MFRTMATVIVSMATVGPVLAQSSCDAILVHGIKNISIEKSADAATTFKYYNNCGTDFQSADENVLAKAEVEIFGFAGGSGALNKTERSQRLKSWCETNKEIATKNSNLYSESQTIFADSVQAWGKCMELNSEKVTFEPTISPDNKTVDMSLRYTGVGNSGVQFYGITNQGFTCDIRAPKPGGGVLTGSDFDNPQGVEIGPQAISIHCDRADAASKTIGQDVFQVVPRGYISVRSAGAQFQLFFPQEFDPALPQSEASVLRAGIGQLAQKLDSATTELRTRTAKLECTTLSNTSNVGNRVAAGPPDQASALIAQGYQLVSTGCKTTMVSHGNEWPERVLYEISPDICDADGSPNKTVTYVGTYCRVTMK